MKKIAWLLLFGSITIFYFSSCSSSSNDIPVISISCNNGTIAYQPPDEEGTPQIGFNRLIQRYGGVENLPYLPLGEYGGPIVIDFQEAGIPDRYELKETLFDANGSTLPSSPLPGDENQLTESGNTVSFLLNPLRETFGSADPKPGQSYRGFQLTCTWEAKTYTYGFILRTDTSLSDSVPNAVVQLGEKTPFLQKTFIKDPSDYLDNYVKNDPTLALGNLSESQVSSVPIISYGTVLTFEFDRFPDHIELVTQVPVWSQEEKRYKDVGDKRSIPASIIVQNEKGGSLTISPEWFASEENTCNVFHIFCTWDGLTSVYSVMFCVST